VIKSFRHRATFILLTLAIASFPIFVSTPVHSSTAISHPGGRIFEVAQAEVFALRYRLRWDEVGVNGYYGIDIYWDCPGNRPYENFTVLYTRAYFDNDNDNLPDPGVDPIDNTTDLSQESVIDGAMWIFTVSNETSDPRDGYFNVDIYMRAASGDGTPHIPTDNHPIWHSMDSFLIAESDIISVPAGAITIRVTGRGIDVSILPEEKSGLPGEVLRYLVHVVNMGNMPENCSLTVSDNSGWNPILASASLSVNPSENKTVELSVTVPDNAALYDEDVIRVTVIGAGMEASASCLAIVSPSRGFDVSISPNRMSGSPGETLIYSITVRNTGNVADDYSLTVSGNTNWNLALSENLLMGVPPSGDGSSTLSVTIPSDAGEGDLTTATVSVTSVGDPAMVKSAVCEAVVTVTEEKGYSSALLVAISLVVIAAAIFAAVYLLRKSRKVGQRGSHGRNCRGRNRRWNGCTDIFIYHSSKLN